MLQSCRPEETQGPTQASKGLVEGTVGNPHSWEGGDDNGVGGKPQHLLN